MPAKELMSWRGKPNFDWRKMRKGVKHSVHCGELGLPESEWTQEDSRAAANAWWERKLAGILGAEIDPAQVRADDIATATASFVKYQTRKTIERAAEQTPAAAPVLSRLADSIEAAISPSPAPQDRRWDRQAELFLNMIRPNVKPRTYREIRLWTSGVAKVKGVATPDMDVATISAATVRNYFLWLTGTDKDASGYQKTTQAKHWGFFVRFVTWLGAEGPLPAIPGNLKSPMYRFRISPKVVKVYALDTVKAELAKLTDRQRLYALLGLNCGCTSVDIGQLRQANRNGSTITRKRIKTEDVVGVPTVTYPLWPETARLLDECAPIKPSPYLLVGKTGQCLAESRFDPETGKDKIRDNIAKQWKNGGCPIILKAFRSVSATLLNSHKDYKGFRKLFLAHSPKDLDERHYAAHSPELFNEAIIWLGQQLGFVQAAPAPVPAKKPHKKAEAEFADLKARIERINWGAVREDFLDKERSGDEVPAGFRQFKNNYSQAGKVKPFPKSWTDALLGDESKTTAERLRHLNQHLGWMDFVPDDLPSLIERFPKAQA